MAISINPNKLNELFEKFKEGGAYNPGDGTTPEITDSDKALLEALFTKYEKLKNEQANPSGTSGDVFQKILEKFKKDDKAFEAAKKYLSYDVEEYSRAKSINLKRQLSVLRMNIENGVVTGELSDAALENMREKYKELKNIVLLLI